MKKYKPKHEKPKQSKPNSLKFNDFISTNNDNIERKPDFATVVKNDSQVISIPKNDIRRTRKTIIQKNNKQGQVTQPNHGHIKIADIDTMKRWFLENWNTNTPKGSIPFELLTIESFLIVHFGYTYETIESIKNHKRDKFKILTDRYSTLLSHIANITGSNIFSYINLKPFMDMCKRSFERSKMFNRLCLNYIEETLIRKKGAFVSQEVALMMTSKKRRDIEYVNSDTKLHTILGWINNGRFVYSPSGIVEKLIYDENYDLIESYDELQQYQTGYNAFVYSDINHALLGIDPPPQLQWLIALNTHFKIVPLLTPSPSLRDENIRPHSATLTYRLRDGNQQIPVTMLVDKAFYDKYKNKSGTVNIQFNPLLVLVNSVVLPTPSDKIHDFGLNLTIACQRLTGERIIGPLDQVDIQIDIPISKPGAFMSKIRAKRDKFLQESKDVYKIAFIAGKASGKSTVINILRDIIGETTYIEDSDDYGKFLYYLVDYYQNGSIEYLNSELTEQDIINHAKIFASTVNLANNDIPSYYNVIVKALIKNDVDEKSYIGLKDLALTVKLTSDLNRLYIKYSTQIRDLFWKFESGDVLNQRNYENGIFNHMDDVGLRTLVSFIHIFACNQKRRAAHYVVRYEPNFDTNIALYSRMKSKELSFLDGLVEILLTRFYSQSAENVSSCAGPAALMTHFGIVPVLKYSDCLHFEFSSYSGHHRVGDNPTESSFE